MSDKHAHISDSLRKILALPGYPLHQSATLAQTNPRALAYWFRGQLPSGKERRYGLSYLQLVEAAFVATFRSAGAEMRHIRKIRDCLALELEAEHPFTRTELKTDALHILNGKSRVVGRCLQDAWEEPFLERIAQFDYVEDLALRWHFRGRDVPLVVDPRYSFGKPIAAKTCVATWALAGQYQAGESMADIQEDFLVSEEELKAALEFEGLLQAA